MKRKTLLALALIVACSGCRGWPEANEDVRELRRIHLEYRKHSVAKNPADQQKLDDLSAKIEDVFDRMDTLTR